jgi:Ca2+-binding RTX toxin-like protein
VEVDLATGVGHGGDAEGDTYTRIEDVDGSEFDDVLKAVVVASEPLQRGSILRGLAGDDKLVAGPLVQPLPSDHGFGDQLEGGDGIDTVSYEDSTDGVVVNLSPYTWDVVEPRTPHPNVGNLAPNSVLRGWATHDTIDGFEHIIGSDYSDMLIGGDNDNVIDPRLATDNVTWIVNNAVWYRDGVEGLGGADTLRVDYARRDTGSGLQNRVIRYGDGSSFGTLTRYVSEAVRFTGDLLDHLQWDHMERYQITGTSQRDFIVGGGFDDILHGEAADDFIFARTGGGDLDGGPGVDTLSAHLQDLTVPVSIDSQHESRLIGGPFDLRIAGMEAFGVNSDRPELDFPIGPQAFLAAYSDDTRFLTGSGNDRIILHGRYADVIDTGPGNDILNPGLGLVVPGRYYGPSADLITGNSGDDLLILDYSVGDSGTGITVGRCYGSCSNGPWPTDDGGSLYGQVTRSVSTGSSELLDWVKAWDIQRLNLTGTSQADLINGGAFDDRLVGGGGNDSISAGTGNDTILGVNPYASSPGRGEIDTLNGWTNADRIILGNATSVFYDDGDSTTDGASDYARLPSFVTSGGYIQLQGSPSNYGLVPVGGGTQIVRVKPGAEPDEIIALVEAPPPGFSLSQSYFRYVRSAPVLETAFPAEGIVMRDTGSGQGGEGNTWSAVIQRRLRQALDWSP